MMMRRQLEQREREKQANDMSFRMLQMQHQPLEHAEQNKILREAAAHAASLTPPPRDRQPVSPAEHAQAVQQLMIAAAREAAEKPSPLLPLGSPGGAGPQPHQLLS